MKSGAMTLALLFVCSMACAHRAVVQIGSPNGVPAPRLMTPATEPVDLTGKSTLKFEWSTEGDSVQRQYYDFRLYKGHDLTASGLISSEHVRTYFVELPVDVFQEGQVYTWSVRQVYGGGRKSRRNFESFKIGKK